MILVRRKQTEQMFLEGADNVRPWRWGAWAGTLNVLWSQVPPRVVHEPR